MVLSSFAPILVNNLPREVNTFTTNNTTIAEVSPFIVMFGSSLEELAAVSDLKQNFPKAAIINFNFYEAILVITTTKSPVIWVGHSSENGIDFEGTTLSWNIISNIVQETESDYHYFLACESSIVTKLIKNTGKFVYSFSETVDAIFASNVISILISNIFNGGRNINIFFSKAISRVSLDANDKDFLPMSNYLFDKLGLNEAFLRIGNMLLLFMAIFLPTFAAVVPITSMQVALKGWIMISDGIVLMYRFRDLLNVLTNDAPTTTKIAKLLLFLAQVAKFSLYFVKTFLPWYRQLAAAGAVTTDSGTFGARAALIIVSVLLYSAFLLIEWNKFQTDRYDYGDTPTW